MSTTTPTHTLHFITGNANKLREVREILSGTNVEIVATTYDLPELQGADPISISRAKAVYAYRLAQRPILIEDTSLCFNALGGLPGPYIKWFMEKLGHDGLNKMLVGFDGDNTSAYALCTFALAFSEKEEDVIIFQGTCEGHIVPPRGPTNFGWDPIFEPNESINKQTFAEMPSEEKNQISHRSRALNKVKDWIMNSEKCGEIFKM
eukprot:PhM_4_TR18934/c0_g1_i2/m.12533/K01519/ITPA; inosine triphosphate pyrophosphatase